MSKKNRSILMMPLLAFALSLATSGTASAQNNCSNVDITIKNSTPDEIKVKRLEYSDGGTFRTETGIFGVDGFQKLNPNQSVPFRRDLEHVGGSSTQIRVTYAHHIGGSKWGSDRTFLTGSFTCIDGMARLVDIRE
jgi:phosphate-selective porin